MFMRKQSGTKKIVSLVQQRERIGPLPAGQQVPDVTEHRKMSTHLVVLGGETADQTRCLGVDTRCCRVAAAQRAQRVQYHRHVDCFLQ